MRIAIFTNNYLPNPYGVSVSIESFRKEFEKLGHVVYIFAPNFPGYKDENTNVFRYPSLDIEIKFRFPLAIPYSNRIDKILEKLEIDIIHSQHPNLLGSAAKKWAKKKNVPLVFTWHTLYDKYTNFVPFIPKKWAAKWTISNAVKYANVCDQIVVPTKSIAKIIQDWGVENKNIIDIPTGIEENKRENADGKAVREKYSIKDEEILLIVVARFTEEKNMEFLFRAVVRALEKNNKLKFLAVGEGYLTEKLKAYVQDCKMTDKIIFTGFVADAAEHYAAGDIFVYASVSETQGMIFLEAMCAGLPIVAVNATGAKDIVQNNETGFLVQENEEEFAEKVIKLAEDTSLRQKFGENAQKIAKENYTSSVCAQKLLVVYEENIKRENKN